MFTSGLSGAIMLELFKETPKDVYYIFSGSLNSSYMIFFLFLNRILRLLTKHILQMQNLKLKKKYKTILQIGSKLHKDEKE